MNSRDKRRSLHIVSQVIDSSYHQIRTRSIIKKSFCPLPKVTKYVELQNISQIFHDREKNMKSYMARGGTPSAISLLFFELEFCYTPNSQS